MSRQLILVLAGVTAALLISRAPVRAEEKKAHPAATAPHATAGHHPTAMEEAELIADEELGGGEGVPVNPLRPEPTLAVWTVIVFLGLFFILGKFVWPVLLKALHDREEHLGHVLHQTEQARNESESLLAEHRRLMAEASNEVKSLLEKARQDAQTNAEKIVKDAQAEAESSRDRARRDIVVARDQALSEIWNTTANLAVSVAGKVLSKQLGEDDHRRLVEGAISELPEAPVSAAGREGATA
jgi:F-type H+-transporting ATPase subunit b